MKLTTIEQYEQIRAHLTARLGINDHETADLLRDGEGPDVGLTESGAAWALWPACANDHGERRAILPASAGGVLRLDHPATAVIRRLMME